MFSLRRARFEVSGASGDTHCRCTALPELCCVEGEGRLSGRGEIGGGRRGQEIAKRYSYRRGTEEAKKRRVNGQAAYLLACRGPGSKSTGRESQ